MATNQKFYSGFQINRSMITTGALLTGLGAVVGLAGTVIVCAAVASAGREWVQKMETPPSELAHRALHQAKAASVAGLDAWRTEAQTSAN